MFRIMKLGSLIVALFVCLPLTACGSVELTARSSCSNYLAIDNPDRYDQAIRLSTKLAQVDKGNPNWGPNTDYFCGSNPGGTMAAAFGTSQGQTLTTPTPSASEADCSTDFDLLDRVSRGGQTLLDYDYQMRTGDFFSTLKTISDNTFYASFSAKFEEDFKTFKKVELVTTSTIDSVVYKGGGCDNPKFELLATRTVQNRASSTPRLTQLIVQMTLVRDSDGSGYLIHSAEFQNPS